MHSYQCHRYHIVFATKGRERIILPEIETEVWRYLAACIKKANLRLYEVGGVEDHIHLLCGIPSAICVADAIHDIKGATSRWMKQRFRNSEMGWQTGYASFTSSAGALEKTINYIRNQRSHHSTQSYEQEIERMIRLHEKGEEYLK